MGYPLTLEIKSELEDLYWNQQLSQEQIGKKLGVPRSTVQSRMEILEIPRRTRKDAIRLTNAIQSDTSPTPNLAYILGVIEGDASVYKKRNFRARMVQLIVKDREFAESFKLALEKIGLHPFIRMVKNKKINKSYYDVEASSCLFYEWYQTINLQDFLKNDACKKAFIRGFYESEGSFIKDLFYYRKGEKVKRKSPRYSIRMVNTDKSRIKRVWNFLIELGFNAKFYGPYRHKNPKYKEFYVIALNGKKQAELFVKTIQPNIKRKRGGF